jgi:hypothetical protein
VSLSYQYLILNFGNLEIHDHIFLYVSLTLGLNDTDNLPDFIAQSWCVAVTATMRRDLYSPKLAGFPPNHSESDS